MENQKKPMNGDEPSGGEEGKPRIRITAWGVVLIVLNLIVLNLIVLYVLA